MELRKTAKKREKQMEFIIVTKYPWLNYRKLFDGIPIHFRRIIKSHTDVSLGDCSYLDTCRHMKTCKFVHYEIDNSLQPAASPLSSSSLSSLSSSSSITATTPTPAPYQHRALIAMLDPHTNISLV